MPHLPPTWVQHLASGVSNRVAACEADGRPVIGRALAARACDDGRIEVLLAADVGREILQAVQATRRVSHVTAHPVTNRALHLKGRDAEVVPTTAEHVALMAQGQASFGAVLEGYGFGTAFLGRVWYDVEPALLRCVRFTPCGAWDQTPGIGAGAAIELLP